MRKGKNKKQKNIEKRKIYTKNPSIDDDDDDDDEVEKEKNNDSQYSIANARRQRQRHSHFLMDFEMCAAHVTCV